MNVHNPEIKRAKQTQTEKFSISFDVFDTFLVRACTTPDGVLERAFQLSPAFRHFPHATTSYVEHRRQAEARARRAARHESGSSEVDIVEIYRYFPYRLFKLSPDTARQLIDAEFAAEIELCRVNPVILARYRELRAAGSFTGFISDTYWNADRLGKLLRSCCPDLAWDFLFACCDARSSKSEHLFRTYLKRRALDPRRAVHIGDNPGADIDGARRHAITPIHVPQASAALASILSREATVGRLLCPSASTMLDGGMRTLRRLVATSATTQSPAYMLGLTVLGPVMHAFDAYVADGITERTTSDSITRVAFLGRDGLLSHRIWSQHQTIPAVYLEINRRVSMVASSRTLDPIIDLVSELPAIDADTFSDIVKFRSPRVDAFLAAKRDQRCSGRELAKALPKLLDKRDVARLATELRRELMCYLRRQIPDLDTCSDLVLVDLGYSGSIQKALRRIFDIEGVKARIHGLYMLTLDDGFVECDARDTFEGLISDLVVTPHVKRMLLRNIALLEQLCCSPHGSVRSYRNGLVEHEDNALTAKQHAIATAVQDGALAFTAATRDIAVSLDVSPLADPAIAAGTATATIARMLLLPTDEELVLFGQLQHDVNLGTSALTPLVDSELLAAHQVTRSLPDACTAGDPPMWLAGSFAALSPAQGFQYLLFGANLLPSDMFGDARCGRLTVTFHKRDGSSATMETSCYRTGNGEMRLRIPMSQGMAVHRVCIPLAQLATEGFVSGPFLQSGDTIDQVVRSPDILKLHGPEIQPSGMVWQAGYYVATDNNAMLTVDLPLQSAAIAVLSIGLSPRLGARVLAID